MRKRIKLAFIAPDILSEFAKRQLAILSKYQNNNDISITIVSPFILNVASETTKKATTPFFKMASDINFDGYILSSNILLGTFGKEICTQIIETFSHKPLISLSYYSDKCCSILVNNKNSMREIVKHFTDFHKYKKIGFVRAGADHNEAEERYQTFLQCMKEAHLDIRKEWIFQGDFQSTTAQYLISAFLKEDNDIPDAIIAVNDNSAIGVLNALKEKKNPPQIAVIGFDNIAPSNNLGLTTVNQPIAQQLDLAISTLIDIISGKKVEPVIKMDTSFIVRSSCGCFWDRKIQTKRGESPVRDDQIDGYSIGYISEFSRKSSEIEDLTSLNESLNSLFHLLRIESAYIYLFNNGDPISTENENIIDEERTILFSYNREADEKDQKKLKDLTRINHIDNALLKHESSMQIISNLQFKNEYYGQLIIVLGEKDPILLALIKQEIETALHHIYTQKTLNKTLLNLKTSVDENQGLLRLLAHDINNPLCNIINSLHILKEELDIQDNLLEYFKIAETSVLTCSEIIDDVLSLQKFKSKELSFSIHKINIHSLCSELNREFKQTALHKGIDLQCNKSFDKKYFFTNIEMLKSILRNLMSNAIKFSPPHKEISVSISTKKQKLIFKISDHGPGFTESDQKKLFSSFLPLSAKPTGSESSTGLGLSLVKTLVDQLGGSIDLKSKEGSGSCFIVSIPEVLDKKVKD